MFFSGDPSRKRVALGGRSSRESDRSTLVQQAKLERERRDLLRKKNLNALKIQKCYRGRKVVSSERSKMREQFYLSYGNCCQKVGRGCFDTNSEFLPRLLFFFDARNASDLSVLVETCRLLRQLVQVSGDVVSLFASSNYLSHRAMVESRVKRLAYACIQAVHQNRNQLKDQLLMSSTSVGMPAVVLLEAVTILTDPKLPWSCKTFSYFLQRRALSLLRDIVLVGMDSKRNQDGSERESSLEQVLIQTARHICQDECTCENTDLQWSFFPQILSLPFLWRHFPFLKKVFSDRKDPQYTTRFPFDHYIHQMAGYLHGNGSLLPADLSREFPGYACLLGNVLEVAGDALSLQNCSFDMAIDFAAVSAYMLEVLPPMKSLHMGYKELSTSGDDEMAIDEEHSVEPVTMNADLEQQIFRAINSSLLHQLVNILFRSTSLNSSHRGAPRDEDVKAVGAICAFLHITFNTLPVERIITGLAYRTELVPMLWKFIKLCNENKQWPSLTDLAANLSGDAPGWLLPLAVFCPVYRHMLMIVDNEEFYEKEKPLALEDIKSLIIILKHTLWQLLWLSPTKSFNLMKSTTNRRGRKGLSVDFIQQRVSTVTSELLMQLQDWNNRRQFTVPSDFHAQEAVDEFFISQAVIENTRAYDILRQAPFLVPFTSRVKIFTSQLSDARQRDVFARNRFRIRRDRMFEDAYSQLSVLSEADLRGKVRVTFVNEFGVDEAGIDGGGIFKDFMENITRTAFDVQYGLFKETSDHLLYPNPGSGLVHEQHLEFFHFLGIVLGKAMFEGILVDIPFATFFLSKLKQKHNFLNDLTSLDPELYRHLIFLKHYKGNIADLELYFVIVKNDYGEQVEEELLPGGKDIPVTNDNVITFIHLIANHHLNSQIRHQSSHFLRGFQKLIEENWISMFNEHELQLLISGSPEGMDVNDLRSHTHYTGGYDNNDNVIETFWEIVKNFSMENQKKFLKFVTGCSRGPLLGFKYLEPQFCIQRTSTDGAEEALDRLPTSATCMNLLKLPPYKSKEQLERKLLYAINADAGFDLS
ncbi:HECT-type E3 ubiquitin transferase [Ranunculus cassubicifolius]